MVKAWHAWRVTHELVQLLHPAIWLVL